MHLPDASPATEAAGDASGRPALTPVGGGWEVDLGHLPEAPDAAEEAALDRLSAAIDEVHDAGGGTLRLWVRGDDPAPTAAAERLGLAVVRELHQMRCPLPLDEEWSLDVRPFVVGQDEAAWVELNNRAFAWHPEQADMTVADLRQREAEPWFDPAGFLLHERDGQLAGFCWTKVHADHDPPLGEIYVIAVDPSAHRRGLGRQLVLAGLDHLHRAGLSVGMLYTEADNEPALRLYLDLGFRVHSSDRVWAKDVAGP
ncbi:MAG TPA: mycothiol synthase [Acidimicrobiales bacterium]|nr:mycothiol synthase [Acidimicrobiales bacterium]